MAHSSSSSRPSLKANPTKSEIHKSKFVQFYHTTWGNSRQPKPRIKLTTVLPLHRRNGAKTRYTNVSGQPGKDNTGDDGRSFVRFSRYFHAACCSCGCTCATSFVTTATTTPLHVFRSKSKSHSPTTNGIPNSTTPSAQNCPPHIGPPWLRTSPSSRMPINLDDLNKNDPNR